MNFLWDFVPSCALSSVALGKLGLPRDVWLLGVDVLSLRLLLLAEHWIA